MAVRGLVSQPQEVCWLHACVRTGGGSTHGASPSVTSGAEHDQIQCSEHCREHCGSAWSRSGHIDGPTSSPDGPLRRP